MSDEKTIVRRARKDRFTVVDNRPVEDDRLSFEALGLLTYLLSRPDNWSVRVDQLAGRGNIGKHKIRRIISELAGAGYMKHERIRDEKTRAFVGARYTVFDSPEENCSNSVHGPSEPRSQNLHVAQPDVAQPPVGNGNAYKELTPTKDEQAEDSRESARAGASPTIEVESPKPLRLEPVIADADAIEATLDALVRSWPPGAVGNLGKARGRIADMEPEERKLAVDAAPRFLRGLKDEKRRYVPAIETYLADRTWERFPEPARAAQGGQPSIELKPYVKELWALFWRAVDGAVKTGDDRHYRRVEDMLLHIGKGLVTVQSALRFGESEMAELVAVVIGSPEHAAWSDWAERHGFALPKPSQLPVVWVPGAEPPPVRLTWKGYRLAKPAHCRLRSPAWWWRLHRIADGPTIEAQLREGGRGQGNVRIEYGPWPTEAEIGAMVEVKKLTDAFDAWARHFDLKGVYLDLWPDSSIWCPSEYPPVETGKMNEVAA